MSDRLAISATMSVLMMAIYVLFGANTAREPLSGKSLTSPVSISMPDMPGAAGGLLPLSR